jgi:uncharacterized membrane protein (DUF2068 family)
MRQRPPTLLVIVAYKVLSATLFILTAVALIFTVKHYAALEALADALTLAHRRSIVAWGVENIAQIRPRTLGFSAAIAVIYAGLSIAEAVGLWLEKPWGRWLVLIIIGISIPPEIYELHKGFSVIKLTVFLLNIGIFFYLMKRFPKSKH